MPGCVRGVQGTEVAEMFMANEPLKPHRRHTRATLPQTVAEMFMANEPLKRRRAIKGQRLHEGCRDVYGE